ncbi:MAG: endonuclease/exonuclease/phosphatase family protein [Fidelibacterota bacterium]
MLSKIIIRSICVVVVLFSGFACDPLVNTFADTEDAVLYEAHDIVNYPAQDTIKVMTWNIRFGAARLPWFGDDCGDMVILKKSSVISNLEALAQKIELEDPDILFLQEVDVESKRTAYINQVQWLLNHTGFNYSAFASMWESQVILADGLGRINTGNAILSKWKLEDAERLQLPLRGDQDKLTQYFYLRRNVLKASVRLPGTSNLFAVNVHATAFATDDTKLKHMERFKEILDEIVIQGGNFVAGGDLNELPPNAGKTDFCLEDRCEGEIFHQTGKTPYHREGSSFETEITWLQPLYDTYTPAVSLSSNGENESTYFTHSPGQRPMLDRKLDYLWTNLSWVPGTRITHQEVKLLSDHVPVSAKWVVTE